MDHPARFGTAPSTGSDAPQTLWRASWRGLADRSAARIEAWLEAERDQLPLWLPVGLGTGITAWLVVPDRAGWIAVLLAALAVAIAAAPLATRRLGRATLAFALMFGMGCALIWWRAESVAAPRLDRPVVTRFAGTVEAVERLPARGQVRVRIAPDRDSGLPPRIRVGIAEDIAPAGLAPGMRIALRARLTPPAEAAVPGGYDFARVAWFQGIGATGRAMGPMAVSAGRNEAGWWARVMDLRARLSAHIQRRLGGGAGAIAAALATGDQGAIPEDDAAAMRRAGLTHLLSISGLHVTAVVGAAMLLTLRLLALSRRLALFAPLPLIAAGVGALAGIAYTLLAGAEVPTVRSCIAALLVLAGLALGRDAITLRLVAAGALVVLLLWPESLAGASFQLSFAAVTAIVALHEHPRIKALFARVDEGHTRRIGRALLALLVTGLAVELALTPIALFHFHRAGLYGALANIVAIPLTTFVVMPLEAMALLLDLAGLGAPFWWLTGQALGLLLWIAHAVGAMPGAVAALPALPRGAFALMITGGLWIALWRTRARRLGLIPLAFGASWALAAPAPDLIVTGDGRHLGVRAPDGGIALLRPRAGDYVRDLIGEGAGALDEAGDLDDIAGARCGPDACAVMLDRGNRRWRLLATRSAYLLDLATMQRACAAADIVVSDRRLPRSCVPRWLKADRALLTRTGGLAITLAGQRVRTVRMPGDEHPWMARDRIGR